MSLRVMRKNGAMPAREITIIVRKKYYFTRNYLEPPNN